MVRGNSLPKIAKSQSGIVRLLFLSVLAEMFLHSCWAQDLAPRAYLITSLHSNAINLTCSFYTGGLDFNGIPITGATGTYSVPSLSFYHSSSFFGRSANVTVWLPYGVGTFHGPVLGTNKQIYRSGLFDSGFRFSVNLKGGPAMPISQFVKWKQTVVLGASLKVIAPTGQYDPTRLINWGINRWAFKPEFGYSQRFRKKWILDGYAGAVFYTTNREFYSIPTPKPQTKSPYGSFEGHLSYDAKYYRGKPTLWFSLDGNFWFGGTTSMGGISQPATKQKASRIGFTGAIPFTQHQAIKAAFSTGAYVRVGGNYKNLAVSWQYSWLGRPN
jgi:Putative MetA-pathway of phenol degradation